MATRPKPDEELVGLVYSVTPKEQRTDPKEHTYPWYRRTVPLACLSLVMVTVLNIIF
jgi:SSS family solute:Na+ symporter